MLASRLFWKIFVAYALLSIVSAVGFAMILSSREQTLVTRQIEKRLHDSASVLRSRLPDLFTKGAPATLSADLEELARQNGTRFTLIAEDGTVLGDSAEDPRRMNNHHDRNEVQQARRHGFGIAQRVSPTLGIPMMYYALRTVDEQGRPVGYVRVAMDLAAVHEQISAVQRLISGTAAAISLVLVVFTYLIVARIVHPLESLTAAAEAISSGDFAQRAIVPNRDEIGRLAEAFNRMSEQLALRIGELQQQQHRLKENSDRLTAMLGAMVEGVIAIDETENILFANRAAQSLLDFPGETAIGRPFWEAIRNPKIHNLIRSVRQGCARQQVELELPRSGVIISLIATCLPGDPCSGVVLVLHDLSELKRLENLRREFVANVSHELKTPLTSIQAYAETLLEGAVDDPEHNRAFLRRIHEQGEHLHALILDLLMLARIESAQDVYEVATVSVDEIVQDCIAEFSDRAQANEVTLSVDPDEQATWVQADAEGLRTILDNLVDNAMKYTPAGGEVSVGWNRTDGVVVIAVHDTGVGIASSHQARIFERFYRVDKARSRELGGTGLGLSIVKHLAQAFQGEVSVASEPGAGSTFSVRLHAADAPD